MLCDVLVHILIVFAYVSLCVCVCSERCGGCVSGEGDRLFMLIGGDVIKCPSSVPKQFFM